MNLYRIKQQVLLATMVLLMSVSAYAQHSGFDVRLEANDAQSKPQTIRDSVHTVKGILFGSAGNATLTGKERIGSLGKMNSDYYDYNTGLQLSFPLLKDKLFFFGNETLSGSRNPSQYISGTDETAHILSKTDEDAIRQYLKNRYGDAFDTGTAGEFSPRMHSKSFYNGIDWLIDTNHKLTLFNHTLLSKAEELPRDRQGFRFSSMGYDQVTKRIESGAEWKSRWSDNLFANVSVGYTLFEDRRDPSGNPNMPQVQIAGRTPGTMIYLGTDREASIFDTEQKSWKVSADIHWNFKNHAFLFGTQNEFFDVDYGYISGWNGRIDYLSIDDFLKSNPYRVRGSYNYANNDRDYILNNPAARFKLNNYSIYLQDEITLSDVLKLTPGLRVSLTDLPDKPLLSEKTKDIWADPNFGTTYSYTPLNRITNDFFNQVRFSPRVDLEYDPFKDKSLIIRAGAGLFTGEVPFSWLAYAYRHTGDTYGDYSQRADEDPFSPGLDPLKPGQNGIGDYIQQSGVVLNNPNSGQTELDLIDNDFQMPNYFRGSFGVDYTTKDNWKFSLEGMYEKTLKDIFFQQVNIKDEPFWYGFDTEHRQPVYKGSVDPRFSSIYLMSNTDQGYKYSIRASINKAFNNGLTIDATYTYGMSKDLMAGKSSSMEANRQMTPSLIPNNPELAYSNSDIRHRINASVGYDIQWGKAGKTNVALHLDASSGSPFTYGIVNYTIQGNSQYVSLVYIPKQEEVIRFFKDRTGATAVQQAEALNRFIDGDDYLKGRRGRFTERNAGRTPWNVRADLRLAHEIVTNKEKIQTLTVSADVINLTNLIYKSWGKQYFASEAFNSTASVGLVPVLPFTEQNAGNYPVYTFVDPGKPYSTDYFASRARLQLGIKYSF